MNEPLLSQIDREITDCESRLTALKAARAALRGAPHAAQAPKPEPARPHHGLRYDGDERERAPKGHLREALLKLLKQEGPLTKRQLVKKLKASSYPYSVRPAHIARNMGELKKSGLVTSKIKDLANVYSLAK